MKCDVDGCENKAERTTIISAIFSEKPITTEAHLCDEHFDNLIHGAPKSVSMGCSIKNEKEINS